MPLSGADGISVSISSSREEYSIQELKQFMDSTKMTSWTPPETLVGRSVAVIGAGVLGRRIGM